MGPSGSGKSAVGEALAHALGVPFADADELHPESNRAKMAAGTPLTDADRMPWLDLVAQRLAASSDGLVVACSALARRYRDRILAGAPDATFVELRVSRAELERRMTVREHFMPPSLLDSQLATWEPLRPDEPGVTIDNADELAAVVASAVRAVQSLR
jgi:gluconokinase